MIKGTVIFVSGVAAGVTACAFAVKQGIRVTSREMTEVLERALSPEDAERVREEFKFKLIELDLQHPSVTSRQRKISSAISGFLVSHTDTKE